MEEENGDDTAVGLFSIIKVEEEHARISEAVKQVKHDDVTDNKRIPAKEVQAKIGRGVMTESFPVEETYPPLPETTLSQQREAGQCLAPAQHGRGSHRRETVI